MAKMALAGLVVGGTIGWVTNENYRKYTMARKDNNTNKTKYFHLQKQMVTWSNNYLPQSWNNDWDENDYDRNSTNESGEQKKEKLDENANIIPEKVTATRNLFLIRHGQYNLEGLTDRERVLTPLGIDQAKTTGLRLSTLPFKFSKMVVSTMTRAQQTATLINEELKLGKDKIENTDLLREGSPFPPEPPLKNYKPEAKFLEDGARIEKAFETFIHRAKPTQLKDSFEIYVCHANVIRYLVCRALQLPPEAWLRMSLHHASITWILVRPSGHVSIRFLGDAGFMPPNQLTLS